MEKKNIELMPVVKFSNNWNNKLRSKAFTTLRLHNPIKYQIGLEYSIILKDEIISTAKIIDRSTFLIDGLNHFIAFLDTGYPKEECKSILMKMYPSCVWSMQKLDLLLFVQQTKIDFKYDPSGIKCDKEFIVSPWKIS